jgi:hypothetical protein
VTGNDGVSMPLVARQPQANEKTYHIDWRWGSSGVEGERRRHTDKLGTFEKRFLGPRKSAHDAGNRNKLPALPAKGGELAWYGIIKNVIFPNGDILV